MGAIKNVIISWHNMNMPEKNQQSNVGKKLC